MRKVIPFKGPHKALGRLEYADGRLVYVQDGRVPLQEWLHALPPLKDFWVILPPRKPEKQEE